MGPFGQVWDHLFGYGSIASLLGTLGHAWNCLVSWYGTIGLGMGQLGQIMDHLVSHGTIGSGMGSFD